jgi:hypothetical protein
MFRVVRRGLVAAVVFAAFGAGAGSAGAVTFVTATVSPTGVKTLASTSSVDFGIGVRGAHCDAAGGRLTASSTTGTLPIAISLNPALAFSGCTWSNGAAATIACAAWGTVEMSALTSGGVTPGTLSSPICTIRLTATPSCTADIQGRTDLSFNNATGALAILAFGQGLSFRNSTCTTTIPNGAMWLTSNTDGDIIYNMTPATTITVM